MVANARVIDELRPRVLAAREAVLGREDPHLRDQLDARAGVYSERRGAIALERNLFAGIGGAPPELKAGGEAAAAVQDT